MKKTIKILLPYILAILVTRYFCSNVFMLAYIPSNSMEDTIPANRFRLCSRWNRKSIDRYDIIVFTDPENPKKYLIKRVIGLPGDVIEIRDNHTYINGKISRESFIKEPMINKNELYNVPADAYFVMGDNRNNSRDSRYLKDHYIQEKSIKAKLLCFRKNYSVFE